MTYEIRLASDKGQYTNYPELETEVNEAFSSFEDPLTGLNIFNGIELGSVVDVDDDNNISFLCNNFFNKYIKKIIK